MAYIIPSVLVYQQLASNAGVANVTPDLETCIIGPAYNVVSYVPGSATSLVSTAALASVNGSAFTLSNNTIVNNVYLGSTKVGQQVEVASVKVYFNSSLVETKKLSMTGTAGSNVLALNAYTGTGTSSVGSNVLTGVTNPTILNVGDTIVVNGVNTGSSNLTTTILKISGNSVTMAHNSIVAVTNTPVTRPNFNNLNLESSTLRVEPGDTVVVTHSTGTVNTSVLALTGSSNLMTGFTIADVLPAGIVSPFTVSVRKTFNNLLLPLSYIPTINLSSLTGPSNINPAFDSAVTNYSLADVAADSKVSINPLPRVSYGTVLSGSVHIGYRALRLDLSNSIIDINNVDEQEGTLGEATDENPLALAVNLALANTVGRILAIAISSDDLTGYLSALDLAENSRLYCIVPLTQRIDILSSVQQHVEQMSTPEMASWRICLLNTEVPLLKYIGTYNPNLVNANSGNNAVTLVSGDYVLGSSNSQFITDGVIPGDEVKITSHTATSQVVSSVKVLNVVSNQQLIVDSPIPLSSVSFYVQRTLSRSQQAEIIAANSDTFKSSRVIHVQPDLVGVIINGVTKYLPGYYLCAAVSGLVSGLPAQQSLTNIGLAGVTDLLHSNRYFTRAQLSTISAAGTFLLVQEAAGTIPYIRHSLTTDMSVLQYRELQQVKNIDFLSYFFFDILKGFPGRYNVTPDTLQVLRTTIVAGAKLLQSKKLPKIGPPLLDYQIQELAQDSVNKDTVIARVAVSMPTVMNYINLYLIY